MDRKVAKLLSFVYIERPYKQVIPPYLKITDIYATACDYQKNSTTTQEFYARGQNKLHLAITGKTAAAIVYSSADATTAPSGLSSWTVS